MGPGGNQEPAAHPIMLARTRVGMVRPEPGRVADLGWRTLIEPSAWATLVANDAHPRASRSADYDNEITTIVGAIRDMPSRRTARAAATEELTAFTEQVDTFLDALAIRPQ